MLVKATAIGVTICALIALTPSSSQAARSGRGDCVRTVRAISDFEIRGDAWTWWDNAEGLHARDKRPMVGSVLVFKRTGHLRRGHVSLVSGIIDKRTITVDHTWADGSTLRRNMKVRDVSPRNDWTMVQVWYAPSGQMGETNYATYGFILPEGARPWGDIIQAADHGDSEVAASRHDRGALASLRVAPPGRHPSHKPDLDSMAADDRDADVGVGGGIETVAAMSDVPPRKPQAHGSQSHGLRYNGVQARAETSPTPERKASKPHTRVSKKSVTPPRKPSVAAARPTRRDVG